MTEQEITDTSHEKDESQAKNVPQAGNNVKQAGQQPHAPGPTDANPKKNEQRSADPKAALPKDVPHSRPKIILAAAMFVVLATSA